MCALHIGVDCIDVHGPSDPEEGPDAEQLHAPPQLHPVHLRRCKAHQFSWFVTQNMVIKLKLL